jgi:hypothetical protein
LVATKYKNNKTVIDGYKFDSLKEAKRYSELMLLQRVGVISQLKMQVKFELIPSQKGGIRNERQVSYIADFVYKEGDKLVIEDVKGMRLTEYVIKRKMMKQIGYEITEV